MMHACAAVTEIVAVDVSRLTECTHRDVINALEREMFKLPQVQLLVNHHFVSGVYLRELFIPAGILLTGKIHKYAHPSYMSRGDMTVLLEDGVHRVQAPFQCIAPPGTKRIAITHADTIWTTIHATSETDLEKIEDLFIAKDEADYLAFCEGHDLRQVFEEGKTACLS